MLTFTDARELMYSFDKDAFIDNLEKQIAIAAMDKQNQLTVYLSKAEMHHFRTIKAMLKARYFCSRLIDAETGEFIIFW